MESNTIALLFCSKHIEYTRKKGEHMMDTLMRRTIAQLLISFRVCALQGWQVFRICRSNSFVSTMEHIIPFDIGDNVPMPTFKTYTHSHTHQKPMHLVLIRILFMTRRAAFFFCWCGSSIFQVHEIATPRALMCSARNEAPLNPIARAREAHRCKGLRPFARNRTSSSCHTVIDRVVVCFRNLFPSFPPLSPHERVTHTQTHSRVTCFDQFPIFSRFLEPEASHTHTRSSGNVIRGARTRPANCVVFFLFLLYAVVCGSCCVWLRGIKVELDGYCFV